MLDKRKILEALIEKLQIELVSLELAADSTKKLATQDDLKSEGKYDTRAIEASYLAGAQQKRVEELKIDIQILTDMDLQNSLRIQLGSLAILECKQQAHYYFLTSISGGILLNIDGHPILVISVFSPLGSEALGLVKGDNFEIETPKDLRNYKILEIY